MKLKILCLHGGRQTAEIFENQLSALTTDLQDIATFTFVDAPHVLPRLDATDAVETRSWSAALTSSSAASKPEKEEEAEDVGGDYREGDAVVRAAMGSQGGHDVVLGFSQGALMACRYAVLQRRRADSGEAPRAVVLAACPPLDLPPAPTPAEGGWLGDLPSFHLIGRKDGIVPPAASEQLARDCGAAATVCHHDHAHSFCQLQHVRQALRAFLSGLTADEAQLAEAAEQREMELEMVAGMYGDVVQRRAAEAVVELPLFEEDVLTAEAEETVRGALQHLFVRFHLPLLYPFVLPRVSLAVRQAAGAQHSTALERWKAEAAAEAQQYLQEEMEPPAAMVLPCYLFVCGQAREQLEPIREMLLRASARKGGRDEDAEEEKRPPSLWELEDEVQRAANIAEAGEEAERLLQRGATATTSSGSKSTTQDGDKKRETETGEGEEASAAAGGGSGGGRTRTLTIGLIGKPSAGKSTFFNAITDPQSEAEAARVAAFPFTTIEPNVGTGFGPVRCPCGVLPHSVVAPDGCDATYGHVPVGAARYRRHPIIVKDVAGLVQGAYLGRGKGNQFLNDLCDADVLVHVVDGAAATEADGSSCAPGEGSALQDIAWVRTEVHSWVYDNLRSKWPSLFRQPGKLRTMFSGYRSSPAFVDGVLQLLGILNETSLVQQLRGWGPRQLHRLVALYVRRRFPMVVALNKSDLLSARAIQAQLRATYPAEHFVPMSAQVECALLALRQRGRLQYVSGEDHFTLVPTTSPANHHNTNKNSSHATLTKEEQQQLQLVSSFFEQEQQPPPPGEEEREATATVRRTTGVQQVLAEALARCAVVFAFPTPALPPQPPSLQHCLTLRPGATAEDVYWTLCYQKLVEGKFVRCEVLEVRPKGRPSVVTTPPGEGEEGSANHPHHSNGSNSSEAATVHTLRKVDVLPGRMVLVRVLTNKRQMT